MLAATWGHLVLGLDFHMVLLPSGPALIPIPHAGIVMDLGSLVLGGVINLASGASSPTAGSVCINRTFAANCGTATMGMHPPAIYMSGPPPADAELFLGSSSVYIQGFRAVRCGIDFVMTCSDPVRLPTGVIVPLVVGRPVFIGGMPTPDLRAIAMSIAFRVAARAARAAARRAFAAARRAARGAARWALRAAARVGGRAAVRAVASGLRATIAATRRVGSFVRNIRCIFFGDPVDVATGRVVSVATDVALPGPIPFKFERSYDSSMSYRSGALGHGWTHSLEQHIREDKGRLTLVDADGREVEALLYDQPDRRLAPGARIFLPREGITFEGLDGGYRIVDKKGLRRDFAHVKGAPAHVAKLVRVSNATGAEIVFTYNKRGLLEWCRDSAGRLIGFEHDASGRLSAIKLPTPTGRGWYIHRRFVYDRAGDLVEVVDEKLARWRYAYETHLLVQRTNRIGTSAYWEYDGLGSKARCIRTWVDPRREGEPGFLDATFQYSPRRTVVQNSLRRNWAYDKNRFGEVVAVVEPNGATTTYENDPLCGEISKQTDAMGGVETWEHDARANMVRHVDPSGATDLVEYDELDRPVRVVDPVGNELALAYSPITGQLVSRVDPTGTRRLFDYQRGVLTSVTTEWGSPLLSLALDGSFNIVGVATEPNERGERASWSYKHDNLGRVTEATDARGNTTRIRRDLAGNAIEVVSSTGLVERHRYDAEDQRIESSTARGHERLSWDALGNVVEVEQNGARQRFERNTEGQLVAIVNENGERYEYELDVCGRVMREQDFMGIWRRYERDKCGRIVRIVLPGGFWTAHTRDVMGRLLRVDHSDGTFRELGYRIDGLVVRMQNEEGSLIYERDPIGRVTRVIADGIELASTYDAHGRASLTSSLGALVRFRNGPTGLLGMRVGAGDGVLDMSVDRDVTGLERARDFSTGLRIEWSTDARGLPTMRSTAVATRGATSEPSRVIDRRRFTWRGPGDLDAIVDEVRGGWVQYLRDERSRVIGARDAWDRELARPLDPAGNILTARDGSRVELAPGGKLLAHSGARCRYDLLGRLVERVDADGSRWAYRWSVEGLLREVERPDGYVVAFAYDALGRRTRKSIFRPASEPQKRELAYEQRTVWDGNVPLHELTTGQDPITWYTEPGSFTPCIKEQGGARFTIATDHLGAPTEMHDELAQLAWKAQLDVFGVPTLEAGERDACPFRWPGQYEDSETGLYYNRFRNYDPSIGRYISPDPIRAAGGSAEYGYVADPTTSCDPLGLVDQGHHTVPHKLLEMMLERGMITQDQFDQLSPTDWRPGLWRLGADAGENQHADAHRALSDYFNSRYFTAADGPRMRRGTQKTSDWELLLSRRTTLTQLLNDFDNFYDEWLPARVRAGHYPTLVGQMPAARAAYRHDRGVLRPCP